MTHLLDGERELSRSYADLDREARAIAARLQAEIPEGERVLLLYPPGPEFVAAFFGCLYASVIAVPVYPPDPARMARSLKRLQSIAEDAKPRAVLTTSLFASMASSVGELGAWSRGLAWLATDGIEGSRADTWRMPAVQGETIAFLQYTSGTTSTPRGVVLSHANLLHNSAAIHHEFRNTEQSRGVSWLPTYHDMGLIGGVIQPVYGGFPVTLLSPLDFLQRPARWLQALSRNRATVSGGPNFAYDLCVRRISPEERRALDLSSWQVAFTGAEPVRPATLEAFARTFAECGFRREAFHPCYGLAEATLMVSSATQGAGARVLSVSAAALESGAASEPRNAEDARPLVTGGHPIDQQRVVIVDPQTREPVPAGVVGEIWTQGPSIARGYWNNAEATAEVFGARLKDGRGPFLRTGDLGFLADDEIVVTGRRKDLIIVRGRNVYPQDLEATAERASPLLRPGCSAAFGVDDGEVESVVLVAEVTRGAASDGATLTSILDAVRDALAREHDVVARDVVLLPPGALPKTSSGKIQRRACRDALLSGELPTLARGGASDEAEADLIDAAPTGDTVVLLRSEVARLLGVAPAAIHPDKPLVRLGLDSLRAAQLADAVESTLGVRLGLQEILGGDTLRDLAARAQSGAGEDRARVPLTAEPGGGDAALSFAQRRLWLLAQMSPASGANNVVLCLSLRGPIAAEVLDACLRELLFRHEVLRATFHDAADGPLQVFQPPIEEPIVTRIDLRDLQGDAQRAAVESRVRADASAAFDLARGPLLRATLLETGSDRATLLLVLHHIVADGRSAFLLAREFAELCAARLEARAAPPKPALRYVDFIRHERAAASGEALERSLVYWKQQLADALPLVDIPTDARRPLHPTGAGARRRRDLSPARGDALRTLARDAATTPFVVILTAVAAVFRRWSRQDDLVLGVVTSTRPTAAFRDVIGDFTNFLPLRIVVSPGETGHSLLARARENLLSALAHAGCPFEAIADAVSPARSVSHNRLYNVALIDHGYGTSQPLDFGAGASAEVTTVDNGTAELDLAFEVFHAGDGALSIDCRYSTDLFERSTIERLLEHVDRALAALCEAPFARIADMALLTEQERRALLVEWNDTSVAYDLDACVHELFESQVDRTPDAIAVTYEGASISYGELDARANRLAHHLRARGVRRGSLVGVCLERSIDMVVALFAALKAGGAYVPLDPDLPPERLSFLRADAAVALVITNGRCAGDAPDPSTVLLDAHHDAITSEPATRLDARVRPVDLAYVIYTSGSTGKPKGAMNAHRAVVNRLLWMQDTYHLDGSDAVLQKTPYSFDVSVWEFFWPLACGARLVVARPGGHKEPAYLVDLIHAERVTTIHFVPSMLEAMLDDERFTTCTELRRVVCSGEALSLELMNRYFVALDVPLHNLYGPTEAAVDVTSFACRKETGASSTVPIGRPIANVRVYVVDDQLRLAPVGARGELCIGGAAVGRGYLRRPGLTAQRFIPDPLSGEPGATLYRTGDEVRLRGDGTIEYLGRLDDQIKLRGYRIELGEVRAVIEEHAEVREAAILVERGASGDRLRAYVIPSHVRPTAAALEAHASAHLPDYMVPSGFVFLDAFPLTPSGKLDRRALASLGAGAASEASGAIAAPPRDSIEEIVAALAAELLGVPSVGVHDDFFVLGGHSLLATQLIARVRKAFGVEIPLAAFFEAPTMAAVASRVRGRASGALLVPPPRQMPRDGEIPLSFSQERLWFLSQLDPRLTSYNVPRALRFRGALDVGTLERAFGELLRRHEILRTTFVVVGDSPAQRVQPIGATSIPVTDLSRLAEDAREEEAEAIVREEGRGLFDLERGPMVRLRLLRMGHDDHVLVLTEHHLVHDGWTQGVLARDFLALYEAFSRGEPSPLPELPLQYADYTLWQRAWLRAEVRERLVDYWRDRLAFLPALDLPTDHPRPAVNSFRGAEVRFKLPPALSQSLRAMSRREGVTLFMTLLAAFHVLMARHARQDDVAIGIAIANRRWEELEGMIGMMINTIIHRCDLSGDVTFRELLSRVRRTVLQDYAHQDLPFEVLVEALRPARTLSHMPFTPVWFGFQDVREPALTLPGLEIEVIYRHNGSAKNDLSLMLVPRAEQNVGTGELDDELGITGFLEYNTDIFEAETVSRMVDHYLRLLEAVVEDPAARIGSLPLARDAEVQRVCAEWNRTTFPRTRGALVHEAFVTRAAEDPAATAIQDARITLTYGELDARADDLARELSRLGVGVGSRVAVCAERGASLLVAILGTVKAGAAYVPLDPAAPRERLRFMLEDACVSVVVVATELVDRFAGHEGPRITLQADGGIEAVDAARPRPHASGARAAYVLYTSGSTGRPKGVEIEHEGLTNLVSWHHRAYAVTRQDRATLLAGPAFDASSWEIWAYLTAGASLHAPRTEVRADPAALVRWMVEERITLSFLPTPLAEQVLLEQWPRGTSLRALLTGGDALRRRPRPDLPFEVYNHYGPTEATVVTTWGRVSPEEGQRAAPSIGRPIDNMRVYLLDERAQVVPIGVRGELCISGVGLARGVVGDAELTARRFVDNPYEPGERMYRTGDLARYRNDGALEFAGRIDWQVKVHGVRIELGEIESTLARHADVQSCAALLHGEGAAARLVAYVVPRSSRAPAESELRSFLLEHLPEPMVPAVFVTLAELPVTPNGKVDRRALPALDDLPSIPFVEPRTSTEITLAAIWSELLDVPRVGVNDDFFALGGHSLLATRILVRVRAAFGVEVPLHNLFRTPTIAHLAAAIDLVRAARERRAPEASRASELREEGEL